MSTDADSARSGRSRDSVHNAVTIGTSIAFQIGISFVPVLGQVYDVFQAVSQFVDTVLDPEHVGTVQTRDTINKTCKKNVDDLISSYKSDTVITAITSAIKQLNPNITDKDLKRQIDIQTALYKREFIYPPTTCFADYVDPDASGKNMAVSFSGPPTDDCQNSAIEYYNAYYDFINANKEKYEEKKNNTDDFIAITRGLLTLESFNKIEKDKKMYDNQLIVVGFTFGLSFLIVLILYLVAAKKEGVFSRKTK